MNALNNYVLNSENAQANFELGYEYYSMKQYASAFSFFLRASERSKNRNLVYESLLFASLSIWHQEGTRLCSLKGLISQALSIQPKRPEAYYLMAQYHEGLNKELSRWIDCYTICCIAESVCDFDVPPLLRYDGSKEKYAIVFSKAFSAWNCGRYDEAKSIFLDLKNNYKMNEMFTDLVNNNLNHINTG